MRICSLCGVEKPLEQFARRGDNYRLDCKSCKNDRHRIWRAANKQQIYARAKEYRQKNKEKIKRDLKNWHLNNKEHVKQYNIGRREFKKDSHLRIKYNINLEQYKALCKEQNYKCSICLNHDENLVVDHCHSSGLIRELLCKKCNSAIGLLKEDINNLNNAISYIMRHNEKKQTG